MTSQKTGTLLTHISTDPEKYDGVVNIPVHRASTIVFKTYEEFQNKPKPPFVYGRTGTPTSAAFEQAMTALEGDVAAGSVSTCSGLSAMVVVALTSVAGSGDHVLMTDNAYGPNRKFCEKMLSHCGVDVEFYAPMTTDIGKLFRKNTKALFIEAPGSLTFEVCDIGALVKAAQAAKVKTIMDNSWSSPLLFRPLEHGVDISVMSCTKYISGHSDAMLGVATGTAETYPRLKAAAMQLGLCAGSEELYTGLRGLRTLHIRLKEHETRGLEMARWLSTQPAVKRVLHPALPSCPGHDSWKKYFKGSCSTFGLVLHETDKKKFAHMLDGFRLFHMGASWGGYELLCFPEQPGPSRTVAKWEETGLSLRLHIGFEDMDDLKIDLSEGFKRLSLVGLDTAYTAPYYPLPDINGVSKMSLSPADLRKLKDAFNEAVKNHPHPDSPAVNVGPTTLSAREFAQEIENETPIGRSFIKMVDDVVSSGAMTFDALLAEMTRKQKPPAP